jgi:hypothetical protein
MDYWRGGPPDAEMTVPTSATPKPTHPIAIGIKPVQLPATRAVPTIHRAQAILFRFPIVNTF